MKSNILVSSTLLALATAQNCSSSVHIIVARGSTELQGEGIYGAVANRIEAQIPGSDSEGLVYPATIGTPTYFVSKGEGTANMTALIGNYSDRCPSAKLVLMGYSQGAHVIGDTLIGNTFDGFPFNTPLDSKYLDRIVAVLMAGDPANVVGVPINIGNATKKGLFARDNSAQYTSRGLVDRTRSYCDFNDTYCDSGSSLAVHLGYIPEYGDAMVDFVVGRWKALSASVSSSISGSSSSTSTGTTSRSSGVTTTTRASSTTTGAGGASTTVSSTTNSPTGGATTTGAANIIRVDGLATFAVLVAGAAFMV